MVQGAGNPGPLAAQARGEAANVRSSCGAWARVAHLNIASRVGRVARPLGARLIVALIRAAPQGVGGARPAAQRLVMGANHLAPARL